jgi:hypothetical protein
MTSKMLIKRLVWGIEKVGMMKLAWRTYFQATQMLDTPLKFRWKL